MDKKKEDPFKYEPAFKSSWREIPIETFDLLIFQQQARDMCCPKKLFALWENVCQRYERREIGIYELEEMKEVIWPTLMALAIIRRAVNNIEEKKRPKRRNRRA